MDKNIDQLSMEETSRMANFLGFAGRHQKGYRAQNLISGYPDFCWISAGHLPNILLKAQNNTQNA